MDSTGVVGSNTVGGGMDAARAAVGWVRNRLDFVQQFIRGCEDHLTDILCFVFHSSTSLS